MDGKQISVNCSVLRSKKTTGELGEAITAIILTYSPREPAAAALEFLR
jgi:hypothetical protein